LRAVCREGSGHSSVTFGAEALAFTIDEDSIVPTRVLVPAQEVLIAVANIIAGTIKEAIASEENVKGVLVGVGVVVTAVRTRVESYHQVVGCLDQVATLREVSRRIREDGWPTPKLRDKEVWKSWHGRKGTPKVEGKTWKEHMERIAQLIRAQKESLK